ncbi:MAG: tRNA lysidine(34) synthetase TilS [Actinomycetota bacterium]|nr:tRNA lysidine(34) synthetase TilS [Actinomycetota bacterium]
MGPHPAVAEVRRAVRPHLGGPVLVACSGGADSLALAAAVAFEAPRAGVARALVTVDHGLHAGSRLQADRVAALGYELGFDPVEVVPVSVGRAGGPEAAARAARYAALSNLGAALDASVLLGHTLDDQAETVLLGLGRGSGPRSIAAMVPRSGPYVRPLLAMRRVTTVAACAALGLVPWDDPANSDSSLQRVRLRREVLPLLEEVLQGGVAEALARTAALLRDDLDALDSLAAAASSAANASHQRGATGELDVAALAELPRALRTRVLRAWALTQGAAELSARHVAALDALVTSWHGQGPLELPGGVRVVRASGRLNAIPTSPVE